MFGYKAGFRYLAFWGTGQPEAQGWPSVSYGPLFNELKLTLDSCTIDYTNDATTVGEITLVKEVTSGQNVVSEIFLILAPIPPVVEESFTPKFISPFTAPAVV